MGRSFAETDCRNPSRIDAQRNHVVTHRDRPSFTERKIVFPRPSLIGMSLDGHSLGGKSQQPHDLVFDNALRFLGKFIAVKTELQHGLPR